MVVKTLVIVTDCLFINPKDIGLAVNVMLLLKNSIFNPFTPKDDLSHPNTMDGRVHSAFEGLILV